MRIDRLEWSEWSEPHEVKPGLYARARYLAADIPEPDTVLGAWRRVGDAAAALWWETIYATRLDRVLDWLERKVGR